jgi:hypothetical protein
MRPDGAVAPGSMIEFSLSGGDFDAQGAQYAPVSVRSQADAQGNISVSLWPNAAGIAGTFYRCTIYVGNTADTFPIVVPEGEGTLTLSTLREQSVDPSTPAGTALLALMDGKLQQFASEFDPPPSDLVIVKESPGIPDGAVPGLVWVDTTTTLEMASLYELAVANGFEGTVGDYLSSITGPAGPGLPTEVLTQAQYDSITPTEGTLYFIRE